MNKIVLDKEYYRLKDEEVNIEIKKKQLTIEIDGVVKINDLYSKEDLILNIILNDNAKLIFNKFNRDLACSNITIDVKNNTYLSFNQSIYTTLKGEYKIFVNILGNNNQTYVNFYGVSNQNGKIFVEADGKVEKNVKNNDMLENIRILSLNDEENIILPNLLVSSDEVSINHNATISGINDDYLFYLEGKGLSKEKASEIITKGFILSKLDLTLEEKDNLL